jgi:hypothetical protein
VDPPVDHAPEPALKREARVLLAWMSEPQAHLALAEGAANAVLTGEQQALLARARGMLSTRAAGIDQNDLIRPWPAALHDYVTALQDNAGARSCLADGFTPALVDLSRVCACRPSVHTDGIKDRVSGAAVDDVRLLAELTLPLAAPPEITLQFDHERLTFVTNPVSQDLQVVGAFSEPAPDGPPGTVSVGFQLRVTTSFVLVAGAAGRYFLSDGYERCIGLLRRGARYVPALVKDDLPLADLAPPGMLPFEVLIGDRPPLLPDYWDADLSCSVQLPASRKIVVIRASELAIGG